MKAIIEWACLVVVLVILYMMDVKHMASSNFNVFLLVLFGCITALVLVLKRCHRPAGPDASGPPAG